MHTSGKDERGQQGRQWWWNHAGVETNEGKVRKADLFPSCSEEVVALAQN